MLREKKRPRFERFASQEKPPTHLTKDDTFRTISPKFIKFIVGQ